MGKKRDKFIVLLKEVKEKNEMKTEVEKQKFYWKVLELQVKKWYIQKKN